MTLLVGWDPGQTYWLADILDFDKPAVWRAAKPGTGWTPAEENSGDPDRT